MLSFNDKLDFLMNITKTSNSALALNTSLDASYISRLRSGKRSLPKDAIYVDAMATYFSKHCMEDYQKKALSNVIKQEITFGNEKTAELIKLWFLDENICEEKTVGLFLDELSNFQFKKPLDVEIKNQIQYSDTKEKDTLIYYGIDGKREAVLNFLSLVLSHDKPQTLLLFSDENMDWMMDNCEFKIKWSNLMSKVIMRGNRINIIHTVSRNLDEMLAAITEWMPLYMTRAIKPYFYPKKRDGIFKRTLFIAPETCAVTSTSVGDMSDSVANFFLKDQKAIKAISEEYNNYLSLCRPLMRIFTTREKDAYFKTLFEFEKEQSDTLLITGVLSILTMSDILIKKIIKRIDYKQEIDIFAKYKIRKQIFEDTLENNRFIEIIRIPNISAIKDEKVHIAFSDMLGVDDLYYTVEEYKLHLQNIILLLQNYENYHVFIDDDIDEHKYMLYVKEDIGAMVAKTAAPTAIMAINESNMTAAFWDFLNIKIGAKKDDKNKSKTIKKLQELSNEL